MSLTYGCKPIINYSKFNGVGCLAVYIWDWHTTIILMFSVPSCVFVSLCHNMLKASWSYTWSSRSE